MNKANNSKISLNDGPIKLRLNSKGLVGQGGPILQLVSALKDVVGEGNGHPVRPKSNGTVDNPGHLM